MSFAPIGNINISKIYKDFNVLTLSNVHALEIGKFIYKEKLGYLPTKIGNYFLVSSNFTEHNYETRVSNTPNVTLNTKIIHRLKSSERSVQFKCNSLWTNLQENLKSSETVNIFKRGYKKHLLSEQ